MNVKTPEKLFTPVEWADLPVYQQEVGFKEKREIASMKDYFNQKFAEMNAQWKEKTDKIMAGLGKINYKVDKSNLYDEDNNRILNWWGDRGFGLWDWSENMQALRRGLTQMPERGDFWSDYEYETAYNIQAGIVNAFPNWEGLFSQKIEKGLDNPVAIEWGDKDKQYEAWWIEEV